MREKRLKGQLGYFLHDVNAKAFLANFTPSSQRNVIRVRAHGHQLRSREAVVLDQLDGGVLARLSNALETFSSYSTLVENERSDPLSQGFPKRLQITEFMPQNFRQMELPELLTVPGDRRKVHMNLRQ